MHHWNIINKTSVHRELKKTLLLYVRLSYTIKTDNCVLHVEL